MKYSKLLIINLIVSYIMSAIMTIVGATGGFFGNNVFDDLTKGTLSGEMEALIFFLAVGFICFIMFNLIYLPFHIAKLLALAKSTINKKYIDTKQSIYTRELPEYNSAIAGEILDLKSTFKEEYIAGVMELIAKGYIIEKENELVVDKSKSTDKLLKNERYILSTCTSVNLLTYLTNCYEFYTELKEDMYDLGLYKRETFFKKLRDKIIYYKKNNPKEIFIIGYIFFVVLMPFLFFKLVENFTRNFIIVILIYLIIAYLIRKDKLTKKGELEKEKIGKLKLFLEKETNFKDKGEEERELWGRYSAFAVALGLNKEMKEEIQNKILKKK